MALLANTGQPQRISARVLSEKSDVSYEFACKILQKLHEAGLIKSVMGPTGGFELNKQAKDITLLEIISAVQGPLSVNDCLLGKGCCSRKEKCPLSGHMEQLQKNMEGFLGNISLEETIRERNEI